MFLFVSELASGSSTIKLPVDLASIAVDGTVAGATVAAQSLQIWDSSASQALPAEEADFDLRLMRSRPSPHPSRMSSLSPQRDTTDTASTNFRSTDRAIRRCVLAARMTRWLLSRPSPLYFTIRCPRPIRSLRMLSSDQPMRSGNPAGGWRLCECLPGRSRSARTGNLDRWRQHRQPGVLPGILPLV